MKVKKTNKMKLFGRNSDYNLILEKILDSKYFSSNSKSLLLSMIYKIEGFYEDYKTVKNIEMTKDDFLNLVLETIKKYCDNVKLVEPSEESILKKNKVLAVTNENERSILCYPTEIAILYAIADIMPKYFYIPNSFEYKNSFQRTLVNGYNSNIVEILSDFNGWSWDVNMKQRGNTQDNLIYQNLMIVFGDSMMEEWKSKDTIDDETLENIKKYFAKTAYFEWLCKYLVSRMTPKEKSKIDKELVLKRKELEKISDKLKYFDDIKRAKIKYMKELDKIILLLNNKDLLRKEYMEKNKKLTSQNRIATLGTYKKMVLNRKEKVINEISNLTARMNPVNYLNYKENLENFIEIASYQNENKDEMIIKLQIEFLKAIKDACYDMEDTNSLKDLIKKLRYYRFCYVNDKKQVKDITEISQEVDLVLNQIIQKLIVSESIKQIINDHELNLKIIRMILDTKIIELNSIKYELIVKDDCVVFKTYEKEVFEKEFEINGKFYKKNFNVKTGKVYKLFT